MLETFKLLESLTNKSIYSNVFANLSNAICDLILFLDIGGGQEI